MAKLITTKEKYGVSVASRIDKELAHQIKDEARLLGLSMSAYLAKLIKFGFLEYLRINNRGDNPDELDLTSYDSYWCTKR